MRADMRTSVENEWLCSKIVAAYGLPIARCEMARFEDQKVLVVERFDRRLSSDETWIVRLPQEDMCQATGTPALHKYESDGGPGIEAIMEVLSGSTRAAQDRRDFFMTQMIFWLLAATDGHAKNFSIAHCPATSTNRRRSTTCFRRIRSSAAGADQFAAQTREARDGRARQERPLPDRRDPAAALDRAGQRVGFVGADVETMIDELTRERER